MEEEYRSSRVQELDGGNLLLSDVSLPDGTLEQVYLGPGGVCVVADPQSDPQALYAALRALLGVVRVRLYLGRTWRYDPLSRTVMALPDDARTMAQEIRDYMSQDPAVNDPDRILLMQEKLMHADAATRGYYSDPDGTLYLLCNGRFLAASDLDPERQFRLTLFGGFLGLHRFAAGKYMTGLLYLLTCGLFLSGWLMDVLQMFLGFQRDRRKALILPPDNRKLRLPLVLPALLLGIFALTAYLLAAGRLLDLSVSLGVSDLLVQYLTQSLGL